MKSNRVLLSILGWVIGFIIFFPILWMVMASLKTEIEAVATPPSFFFTPTLENYFVVQNRSDYLNYAWNSIVISVFATLLAILIAVPASYSFAFQPTKRTKFKLVWILSTKMMPPVGVLIPMYLFYKNMGLLDTHLGLILIYTLMNLPIVIWVLYTYFKDIPQEILEAAQMECDDLLKIFLYILLPLSKSAIFSTSLLSIVLIWNESFWSLNLTAFEAAPLTAFISSYSSPEGLFWAKLSAASTLAILPILFLGWVTQKQMVKGLTLGAVK